MSLTIFPLIDGLSRDKNDDFFKKERYKDPLILSLFTAFLFMTIVALFNVIGAIIMMIIDQRKNLKTLYNLGVTVSQIKKIFVLQGFLLTFFGMLIGVTIGIILLVIQVNFELFMIVPNVPYPIEFQFYNLFLVISTILVLGFIASKIASSRITKEFIEK